MKRKFLFWAAGFFLALLCLSAFLLRETLNGSFSKWFGKWDEEAFVGKPVIQLEQALAERKAALKSCDAEGFRVRTGRPLRTNERVMLFLKGEEYNYFGLGTARNVGYVVIQTNAATEIVSEIVRETLVESL